MASDAGPSSSLDEPTVLYAYKTFKCLIVAFRQHGNKFTTIYKGDILQGAQLEKRGSRYASKVSVLSSIHQKPIGCLPEPVADFLHEFVCKAGDQFKFSFEVLDANSKGPIIEVKCKGPMALRGKFRNGIAGMVEKYNAYFVRRGLEAHQIEIQ